MDPSWSPACQIANYKYKVPRCSHPRFFDCVLEICNKHRVDLIVPNIDAELIGYAENQSSFKANGTEILISSLNFIRTTRDKGLTARMLKINEIPVPFTWEMEKAIRHARDITYPVLIKPRAGSSSQGIAIVKSQKELIDQAVAPASYIVQEFCRGEEFTINCFYDISGKCVACVPHFRKFVRAGEVCFAQTIRVQEFRTYADKLSQIFPGIRGPICFQGFKNETGPSGIIEINARFGGGYPICDQAGGTFAKWILQEILGEIPDYNDDWQEGVRMLRYDAAIFTNKK